MEKIACVIGYPIKENKILLGIKKRGFGKGKINGFGGKVEAGEDFDNALIREAKEELGIEIKSFRRVAFLFFKDLTTEKEIIAMVYLIEKWLNEPKESEEFKPRWFSIKNLPYDGMWEDDRLWLPIVLKGKRVWARFYFEDLFGKKPKLKDWKIMEF